MSDFLFNEFNAIPPKAWKQKIQVELDGLDYNKTLLWQSLEGITVKPFYTKEDRDSLTINLPKENFKTCQTVFIHNEEIANKLAIDAIDEGIDSISFTANNSFDYIVVLSNIDFNKVQLYFNLNFLDADFCIKLSKFINNKKSFFNVDIIGNLSKTGNWFKNIKTDFYELNKINNTVENSIAINASIYQNAGANCIQQLAYALAHANEYLNHIGTKTVRDFYFIFSVGSNYFFEIAKLRAFRILWDALLKEHNTNNIVPHIYTQPTLRNKTLYNNEVNMLRSTSECLSAIFGGGNTISNVSYDAILKKSNTYTQETARNQLLILQEESGLNNAQFYANGSYYIESLTTQLAEKALDIFKQIEQGGGFLKQLKTGVIQKKITETAQKEQELFNKEKLVLIGGNLPNKTEQNIKDNIELFPFVKKRHQKTLIQPLIAKRLSEDVEQKRLQDE